MQVETDKQCQIANEVAAQIWRGESVIAVHGSTAICLDEAVTSAALMGWQLQSRGTDDNGRPIVNMALDNDSPMRNVH